LISLPALVDELFYEPAGPTAVILKNNASALEGLRDGVTGAPA
jgi:hypothetical protein